MLAAAHILHVAAHICSALWSLGSERVETICQTGDQTQVKEYGGACTLTNRGHSVGITLRRLLNIELQHTMCLAC